MIIAIVLGAVLGLADHCVLCALERTFGRVPRWWRFLPGAGVYLLLCRTSPVCTYDNCLSWRAGRCEGRGCNALPERKRWPR